MLKKAFTNAPPTTLPQFLKSKRDNGRQHSEEILLLAVKYHSTVLPEII